MSGQSVLNVRLNAVIPRVNEIGVNSFTQLPRP